MHKSSDTVRALRDQLEKAGQLVNRVLQIDLPFDSQSGALKFLNGTSLNGSYVLILGNSKLKQMFVAMLRCEPGCLKSGSKGSVYP